MIYLYVWYNRSHGPPHLPFKLHLGVMKGLKPGCVSYILGLCILDLLTLLLWAWGGDGLRRSRQCLKALSIIHRGLAPQKEWLSSTCVYDQCPPVVPKEGWAVKDSMSGRKQVHLFSALKQWDAPLLLMTWREVCRLLDHWPLTITKRDAQRWSCWQWVLWKMH